MPELPTLSLVPGLTDAKSALAQLATSEAVEHLESALQTLQALYASFQNGGGLSPEKQRSLQQSLLGFQRELREAAVLNEQGLSYCQERGAFLQPPPAYQANGTFFNTGSVRHELSLDA